MEKQLLKLRVNGEEYEEYVSPSWTLLRVLRDVIGLTGTKQGCEDGYCGACTVLVNGKAVKSCLMLAHQAQGKDVVTVEGLAKDGQLDPLQQAFIDAFAVQCGYCTPGMIMAAKALLAENPHPTEDEIRETLQGNLCRCTGYKKIVEAVQLAASR